MLEARGVEKVRFTMRPCVLLDAPWAEPHGSASLLVSSDFAGCVRQIGSAPVLLPLLARAQTSAQLCSALRLLCTALLSAENASMMVKNEGYLVLASTIQVGLHSFAYAFCCPKFYTNPLIPRMLAGDT
jgi:hypothetical protein